MNSDHPNVLKVFQLRRQGRTEEAYETARLLYAEDKGPHTSAAMYLSAVDKRQQLISDGQTLEAEKIDKALERLLQCTPEHLLSGIWGEEEAVNYLQHNGYDILECDWHSKHRDIDIVARQGSYIVFIEVKTRRNRDYLEPESAVNYPKQQNLRRAINHYVKLHHIDAPWRFDVITVVGSLGTPTPDITHIEDFTLV